MFIENLSEIKTKADAYGDDPGRPRIVELKLFPSGSGS